MNIMLLTSSVLVAIIIPMATTQQCRQVTVCNDDAISLIKGQKGDVGLRGKAGPFGANGAKGEPGEVGEKGLQGESCALGSFGNDIMKKLTDIEAQLNLLTASTTTTTTTPTTTLEPAMLVTSCANSSVDGRQVLRSGVEIYCEDGWTVFQKRYDGSINFQLNWNEYKNGFGNFDTEFWLGLDKIHTLTSQGNCRLRVDLGSFDGEKAFAEYSSFSVDNERDLYRLHVSGYSGTAGDSLAYHNNRVFSSPDRDHDGVRSENCATYLGRGSGGWWFQGCLHSALNAAWGRSEGDNFNIVWGHWKGRNEALQATTMKLRCD